MDYRDYLEINFGDMLRCVAKKWRSVLVCMIVCMVLAGAYVQFMPPKTIPTSGESTADGSELEALKKKISDVEAWEAAKAVQTYLDYESLLKNISAYSADSKRMSIDASRIPTSVVTYLISDYEPGEPVAAPDISPVDSIVALYYNALSDSDVISQMRKETGWDIADSYFQELFTVTRAGQNIMSVSVIAPSEGECEKLAKILESNVTKCSREIKSSYAHFIEKTGANYYERNDAELLAEQKLIRDNQANIEKNMLTLSGSMTADQKAYYVELLKEVKLQEAEDGNADVLSLLDEDTKLDDASASDQVQEVKTKKISRKKKIKLILLAAIIGAFLAIVWYAVLYVITATVKTRKDLSGAFKLPVLGEIVPDDDKKLFGGADRFINLLFMRRLSKMGTVQQLNMITANIGVGAQKLGAGKICISGTTIDPQVEKWKNSILEEGTKEIGDALKLGAVSSPFVSPQAMEEFSGADATILVEKAGVTRYEDLVNMIEICRRCKVEILGTVLVY